MLKSLKSMVLMPLLMAVLAGGAMAQTPAAAKTPSAAKTPAVTKTVKTPKAAPVTQADAKFVASGKKGPFHKMDCASAKKIAPANVVYYKSREAAVKDGHEPCKICKP